MRVRSGSGAALLREIAARGLDRFGLRFGLRRQSRGDLGRDRRRAFDRLRVGQGIEEGENPVDLRLGQRGRSEPVRGSDPTARFLLGADRPFRWSEALAAPVEGRARRRGEVMMRAAAKHGLKDGWTFPITGRSGLVGAAGFGGEGPYDWDAGRLAALWGFVTLAYRAAVPQSVSPSGPPRVTRREREVLGLLAQGRSNGEIASALYISENTVRNHLANAYAKIGVSTAREAVAWCWRMGFASAPGDRSP